MDINKLIEYLNNKKKYYAQGNMCSIAESIIGESIYDDILKYIKQMENNKQMSRMLPVQPEQRWISCDDRLPEVGRSVLFSVGGMYTAEGCLRSDGDWTQFRWNALQRSDMVDAWMPLLKPYKEEQDR